MVSWEQKNWAEAIEMEEKKRMIWKELWGSRRLQYYGSGIKDKVILVEKKRKIRFLN
jgi:hypothetical protein